MMPSEHEPAASRQRCVSCFKPAVSCVCASLPRVRNRTPVWIVQHPRERFHALGTVRLISGSLERVHVDIAHRDPPPPRPPFGSSPRLLYPDPTAPKLSDVADSVTDIVVVDGTWHHARSLLRDIPWLGSLPRCRLDPEAPSRYRLRREPARDYVSSVEATAQALSIVEPRLDGLEKMLGAFDAMIDRQIELGTLHRASPRERTRREAHERLLPRALASSREHVVVTYAEWLRSSAGRTVVQWVAWRARDGATFQALIAPPRDAAAELLQLAGLSPAQFQGATSAREAAVAFERFAGSGAKVTAWLDQTVRTLPLPAGAFSLKAVYGRLRPKPIGTLDEVVARHALPVARLPVAGRAAWRLGCAVSLLAFLDQPAERH